MMMMWQTLIYTNPSLYKVCILIDYLNILLSFLWLISIHHLHTSLPLLLLLQTYLSSRVTFKLPIFIALFQNHRGLHMYLASSFILLIYLSVLLHPPPIRATCYLWCSALVSWPSFSFFSFSSTFENENRYLILSCAQVWRNSKLFYNLV
jgi:hypothetical protein